MCGNVWEWCRDYFDEYFYRKLQPGTKDPVNKAANEIRSIRGGSFQSFETMGRCAFRGSSPEIERRTEIGFRVVYNTS